MYSFGCLSLSPSVLNIVAGTFNLTVGLVYMIMSFIHSFPPPNPIVINWQNWKDFSAEGLDLARPKHVSIEVNDELFATFRNSIS